MILTRRGFLKSCLALAAAPAIVRAESLMKLWVPPQGIIVEAAVTNLLIGNHDFTSDTWRTVKGVYGWTRALTTEEIMRITT